MPRARRSVRRPAVLQLAAMIALAALSASPLPTEAAWPNAPALNLPVCTAGGSQFDPVIASDGAGGAYVAWEDNRVGNQRIYAQHILASGIIDPAWPVNGLPVVTATTSQSNPRIVWDGASGAIVSFEDTRVATWDVYAQHLIRTGVDPAWPAAGVAVCTATDAQNYNSITTDGLGGAIISWVDWRTFGTTGQDVYAQRVRASGTVDPAWPANGRAICTANGSQGVGSVSFPMPLVSDGAGGAYLAWLDSRSGAGASDVYTQRVLATGAVDPTWPANGRAVCVAANIQSDPVGVTDGSGGMFLAWADSRSTQHIYSHHVTAAGLAPSWPVDGLSTNNGIDFQSGPLIVSDGVGGAFAFWSDYRSGFSDVYAQHLTASGLDPAWPVGGTGVITAADHQGALGAVSDGAGGAIVQDLDLRFFLNDLYAQHLRADGSVDPRWPVGGRAVATAAGDQVGSWSVISDGAGGMITAFNDLRTGGYDIYAQRVARFSYLGTPEAEIAGVDDVPNDQGGKVKLSWYASYLDTNSDPNLNQYDIYRSIPPNVAHEALAQGARLLTSFADAPREDERAILEPSAAAGPYFWEYVTSQSPMHFLPTYSYVATTTGDSTGAYNPLTAFMIVGRSWDGTYYWLSRPDSGYSADNLPPSTPAPFTGEYSPGATALHWNPNSEADLAHYRLYRGTSAAFVPGPGNLVASPPDTGHVDAVYEPFFYKLSAVDSHGNESGFALLLPSGTLDAPGPGLPHEVALGMASPNPAKESARFELALPRAGRVSLVILDAGGRRVRELVSGNREAGKHSSVWDLRDENGGRVAPGLYFATLRSEGSRRTQRFTVLE